MTGSSGLRSGGTGCTRPLVVPGVLGCWRLTLILLLTARAADTTTLPTCHPDLLPPGASLELCQVVYPEAKESELSPFLDPEGQGQGDGTARHARDTRRTLRQDGARTAVSSQLTYRVSAPALFEEPLRFELTPALDFLSPGFVIQRVSGNSTWLEQVGDLTCFYSGYLAGHRTESALSLALCDGMKRDVFFYPSHF
ncbi:hypothetical protein ACOMHN_052905 [Nucella lapillus]